MKRLVCQVCGHCGCYRSEALAKAAFGRHSCATNVARQKRARRRIERLNTPGPIRECAHGSRHSHGTRAAYVLDRCRCPDCKRANREAERVRSRNRLYGRSRLVEASTARAHVRSLMAEGMGWKRVASVGGVAPSTVSKLIYGRPSMSRPPSKQIERRTADRLLSVQFTPAGGAIMSTVGTRRRLQALMTLGWSQAELARRLDMRPSNLAPLLHGRRQTVSRTADLVIVLYGRMWNCMPPTTTSSQRAGAARSRGYADQHRWAPPMAWDDDDIDDPAAAPAGTLGLGRGKRPAVDPEEILMLAELGHSPEQIAARVSRTLDGLYKNLSRRDRLDVWAAVAEREKRRRSAPSRVA